MAEETITLDPDAYGLLEAQRHEDESYSDVIRRLLGPGPPEEDVADGSDTMEDVAETAGDEDAEM